MEKTLFACDLDNTLIYSYKHAEQGDICVEYLDGKAISFMPQGLYDALRRVISKYLFVPVTTRSSEQYSRIDLGFTPPYALAANGAVLFEKGEYDTVWYQDIKQITAILLPEIKTNANIGNIRVCDGLYYQIKSADPRSAVCDLRSYIDTSVFDIASASNKVYIIPRCLNKGFAVKRLADKLGITKIIAAGDSELDIPMLRLADIAIYPKTLAI